MSYTYTYNRLFLELIDNVLNAKSRFENHEIDAETLIAEIRVNYLETIQDFCDNTNTNIISLQEYRERIN